MDVSLGRAWLAALLLLGGCGGSGGGSSGSEAPPSWTGELQAVSLEGRGVPTCTTSWGPANSDGQTLSLALFPNVDGAHGGPVSETFGLSASSDGTLTLRNAADVVFAGAVGAARTVALAGNVRAGDAPRILTLVRRTYPTALADLTGSYRLAFFSLQATGARSVAGNATFDGAGAGTFLAGAVVNSNGLLNQTGSSTPMTYAISTDGEVDLNPNPGQYFHGGLDVSRDWLVLGGETVASRPPGIVALVRYASATGPDVLSGAYTMVGLRYAFGTSAMRSFAGEFVADGLGTATVQGTFNIEGVITPMTATSWTYLVSGVGALDVITPEGAFVGGVCQSGDFAVLGGPNFPGADPALYLLIRR